MISLYNSRQLFQPPSYNTHYQRESGVAALLPLLSVGLSNATPGDWGALIDRPCFVFLCSV